MSAESRVDPRGPRFARGVGFGYVTGAIRLGVVATSFALFAAILDAGFDFCLGHEPYLLIRRLMPSAGGASQ